jgi:hypothetical protein
MAVAPERANNRRISDTPGIVVEHAYSVYQCIDKTFVKLINGESRFLNEENKAD